MPAGFLALSQHGPDDQRHAGDDQPSKGSERNNRVDASHVDASDFRPRSPRLFARRGLIQSLEGCRPDDGWELSRASAAAGTDRHLLTLFHSANCQMAPSAEIQPPNRNPFLRMSAKVLAIGTGSVHP